MSYFRRKKVIPNSENATNLKYAKPLGVLLPFNNPKGIFKLGYTNEEQVYSNLKNLLLTAKGERYMLPTFGTDIRTLLFENISTEEEFFDSLKNEIRSSITEWMPYLVVSRLDAGLADEQEDERDHSIKISLVVQIVDTGIYLPIQIFIDETGNLNITEALNNGWFS